MNVISQLPQLLSYEAQEMESTYQLELLPAKTYKEPSLGLPNGDTAY